MAEPEVEAAWRAESSASARNSSATCSTAVLVADEPKRQATFRWLGDEAEERQLREEKAYHYFRWTFFAAIAAVMVGLIGVGLTVLH
jgi:hypothetical protein